MDKLILKYLKNYGKYIIVKVLEFLFYIRYKFSPKKCVDYQKEFKKIALICTKPMGFGDLIMDTPFIKTLRKYFPDAEIHLITDKDIFDKVNELDKIIVVKGGIFSLMKEFYKLRKEKYDLGIIMNRGVNQTFYLEILNPKYKLGYLGGWKILANFKLKKDDLIFTRNEHYWNMALKIAESLGIEEVDEKLISVDFSADVKKNVEKIVNTLKLDKNKKTVVINPFVLWKTRMWDKDNYVKLIEEIHKDFNIILYGGPDAIEIVNYIKKKLEKKGIFVNDVAGKLNLKEAIYFLKFADLFITSDSGPMHFAFLMRTPTLALFGPVNPRHRLPKNFKEYRIYDYLWYNDYKPLKKFYNYEYEYIDRDVEGLNVISVEDVKNKIYKFFKNGRFY
ncbi:Glycosyl transferase family 9 [Methanocaldococcus lauensis]|nr:Glycosyl transferase family 9 [Methanocaldococcus lauensis]